MTQPSSIAHGQCLKKVCMQKRADFTEGFPKILEIVEDVYGVLEDNRQETIMDTSEKKRKTLAP